MDELTIQDKAFAAERRLGIMRDRMLEIEGIPWEEPCISEFALTDARDLHRRLGEFIEKAEASYRREWKKGAA